MQTNTQSIRVYVPKAVPETTKRDIESYMSARFGGYSAFDCKGGWESDAGEIIQEPVTVYESVADTNQPVTVAKRLAQMVKAQSDEDTVMWDIRPITASGYE